MEICAGNNAFAVACYRHLCQEQQKNLFFSPYSISMALAMTWAGAQGETAAQMASALHFQLPPEALHAQFGQVQEDLERLDEASFVQDERFCLNMANAIWVQSGVSFNAAFLSLLETCYDAGPQQVDFAADAGQARRIINTWVSDRTEAKIQGLIPEGAVDAMTRLVLTNAVYFFGDWLHPFSPQMTRERTFFLLDGEQVKVPMMTQTGYFDHGVQDNVQMLRLPYVGERISMILILPDSAGFTAFEAGMTAATLDEWMDRLEPARVAVTLPRYSFESGLRLARTLAALGMVDAFQQGKADFSGMDGTRELFISEVLHKAFVAVDEKGTEAAAATAVVMTRGASFWREKEPVPFTADHPFLFLIRDDETGLILFMGRVLDPS